MARDTLQEKSCTKCCAAKPLDEFHSNGKGGLTAACRQCRNAASGLYAQNNQDRTKARSNAYYIANKEKILATARKKYSETPELFRAANRAWGSDNKDKKALSSKNWRIANPEKMALYSAHYRRAKKRVPLWADLEIIGSLYKYAFLMRKAGVECEVDHVIPLHGRLVMGLHTQQNMTVISRFANRSKGNKVLYGA